MLSLFHPRREIPRLSRGLAALVGFIIFGIAWNLLSLDYERDGKAFLLPSPQRVASTFADYFGYGSKTEAKVKAARQTLPAGQELDKTVLEIRTEARLELGILGADLRVSIVRVTLAFLLSVAVGVPIGIAIGSLKIFESLIQPLVEFIRYVPVPALVPLLMIIFGIGEAPKIMLIFIGTVFQLMLMTADEIRRVPYELLQVSYTLGGSRIEAITKVLLPGSLPGIFDAMRLCNGWAWTWLIVAELVAANEGMGFRIVKYQRFLLTDKIFVYLIVLGLIGLLIDFLFRALNQRMFRWAETNKR